MTTRVLPVDEWDKLEHANLGGLWNRLPNETAVMVVEDAGEIVGCVALMPVWHAEGLWIRQSHRRRGGVMLRLYRALRSAAKRRGLRGVFASSMDECMTNVIERLGGADVPGRHFTLPMGE